MKQGKTTKIRDARAGQPISARHWNALKDRTVRSISGDSDILVRQVGDRYLLSLSAQMKSGGGIAVVRTRVQSIENDYVVVRTWDGTNEGQSDINVAKPHELIHDYTIYDGLTSMTTVGTQEVTASDGTDTETWKVTPAYVTGEDLWMMEADPSVTVNNIQFIWIDANRSGRAWAKA